jgi:hypothetical protein
MVAVLLLVVLTLAAHRWLIHPLAAALLPLLDGSWAVWSLLLLGLWVFTGPRRRT